MYCHWAVRIYVFQDFYVHIFYSLFLQWCQYCLGLYWIECLLVNMVIFFKKGNRKDIKNYRPIFLLSNMYKLFTKIITTRLEKKLNENQPREKAGFRSKYSTTDHIHAINHRCIKYKKNLIVCMLVIIMAGMAVFYVAGYLIEERRRWPVITASPPGQCS